MPAGNRPTRLRPRLPVDRPRAQHVRAQRAPQHLLRRPRGGDQLRQVDPRLDPHLVQHRDHVLAADVAGRARRHRTTTELAEARLEGLDTLFQGGQQVGQPLAPGVVEVGGQLDAPQALARGREELVHLARVRHPGGVPEADLLAAGGGKPLGDLEDALGRHLALVGAAEGGRDHALAPQPRLARRLQRHLQPVQRLLDRAVDVAPVVGLRGGEEDADLVEAVTQLQRPLEPALVRDQDREGDPVAPPHRPQHLGRVGQLRDHVRPHERGDLHPPHPGRREQVDQPHLVGGRDRLRLVLEPVAGPDLADADALRQLGHRGAKLMGRRRAPRRPPRRRATSPRTERHVFGLIPNLLVGEAQAGVSGGGMPLVAQVVPALLGRSAVMAQAVGLDHQPQIPPEKVDLETVDPDFRLRHRQADAPRHGQKEALEARTREPEGAPVQPRAQARHPWLAAVTWRAPPAASGA